MFALSPAASRKLLVLLSLLLLLGTFWLPYHVPTPPSISDSYIFGFNNRVAWMFFLALIGLFLWLGPKLMPPEGDGGTLSRSLLGKAFAGTFATTSLMYLIVRPLAGYGESEYLADRVRLLLAGYVPYRDLEYPYGPAFLYGPAWLARLLHLDVRDAYGLFYIATCLAGTVLLWTCLQWVDGPLRARRSTFFYLWGASLISTLNYGLNYSIFRFIFPLFWVLLVHRAALRRPSGSSLPFAIAVTGYAAMLLVSPELGIAVITGSLLYLAYLGRSRPIQTLVACAASAAVAAALTWLAFRLGVLRTMLAIRVGALNFPVIPALHIWLYLAAAAITACVVGTLLRAGRTGTALPLFCYALPLSAAALGRCDGGHILLNGLPLFVCSLVALGGKRSGRSFFWLMWLIFLVPNVLAVPQILGLARAAALPAVLSWEPADRLTSFDHWVLDREEKRFGPAQGSARFNAARTAAHGPPAPNLAALFHQPADTIFDIPYGFVIVGYGRYQAPALDPGYFLAMADVGTPRQVQDKVDELRQHPDRPLLLPPGSDRPCVTNIPLERHTLSRLFLFPYRAKAVHEEDLTAPLCTWMQTHYHPTTTDDAAHFHYILWEPNR